MRTEPPAPGTADRPRTATSPVRILPLVSHPGNQRLLADWVDHQEEHEMVSGDDAGLSKADLDTPATHTLGAVQRSAADPGRASIYSGLVQNPPTGVKTVDDDR